MPRPTPSSYSFDPDLIHRAPAPPPIVLGGVLRGDSPFLDAMPGGLLGHPGGVADAEQDAEQDDEQEQDGPAEDALDGMLYMPLIAVTPEPREPEPAGPAAPFDRAAVERARARAARPSERVEASVWSDDGVAEHVCDVSAWLAGATRRELEALAAAGWAGDEAEEVAAALADDDPEVADVLRHARRADAGVVVEIDARAAQAWLARHRPAVAVALEDEAVEEE